MKLIVLAISLAFSVSAFSKTPATLAVSNLINAGVYEGVNGDEKCQVSVTQQTDKVSVSIKNTDSAMALTIVDNAYYYEVNDSTGEITATQNLSFPGTYRGGSKVLNIRSNTNGTVEFFLSSIRLGHDGQEDATYLACKVTL